MELLLAFFNPTGRDVWPSVIGRILLALGIIALAGVVGYQLGTWVLIPLLAAGWHLFEVVVAWLAPLLQWVTLAVFDTSDVLWREMTSEAHVPLLVWYGCLALQAFLLLAQVAFELYDQNHTLRSIRQLAISGIWIAYLLGISSLSIEFFKSPSNPFAFIVGSYLYLVILFGFGFGTMLLAHYSLQYSTHRRQSA